MRRWIVALAFFAAFITIAATASGGNSVAFRWYNVENWQQGCNDWQSTPTNCVTPNGCAWGDEDDIADYGYGKVSSGETVSDTLCIVSDMCSDYACPHYAVAKVEAPLGTIIRFTDDRGGSYLLTDVGKTGGNHIYETCVRDPYYTGDPDPSHYPPIPGTNGGVGYVTHWTLAVTPAKTAQINAGIETAQNYADGRYGYYHQLRDVPCNFSPP